MSSTLGGSGIVSFFYRPTAARALMLSSLVGIVWFVLAWRSPTLTYHFAPLVGAALGPLSLRTQGRADAALARKVGLQVLTILGSVTLLLEVAGRQEGPNFLHVGPAWPEAVLFIVLGVLIGVRSATRARPGILGSIVDTTV